MPFSGIFLRSCHRLQKGQLFLQEVDRKFSSTRPAAGVSNTCAHCPTPPPSFSLYKTRANQNLFYSEVVKRRGYCNGYPCVHPQLYQTATLCFFKFFFRKLVFMTTPPLPQVLQTENMHCRERERTPLPGMLFSPTPYTWLMFILVSHAPAYLPRPDPL